MSAVISRSPAHTSDDADATIEACLDLDSPKSFFLFAGAGSGKTGTLVRALEEVLRKCSRRLRLRNQSIAVITYTNAACDEVQRRIRFDPLVEVSTIHSFVWRLIQGFNEDIRDWVEQDLKKDISELDDQITRTKNKTTKTYAERVRSVASKRKRLEGLSKIKRFTYNPNGDNRERDSLNHTEVVEIAAGFLVSKPLMRDLLINKHPILLIDESQDTNKNLMSALLGVQEKHQDAFCMGLFGDMMQRIYADGLPNLERAIPPSWEFPKKLVNHRCPKRIVDLINRIRSPVSDHTQKPKDGAGDGVARLFVVPASSKDKSRVEAAVKRRMAEITGDQFWVDPNPGGVKSLILEHHMAAQRMGFLPMFKALAAHDSLKTGLLDGTLSGVALFADLAYPVVEAQKSGNQFSVASIVRSGSPLLDRRVLAAAGNEQLQQLEKVRKAVEELAALKNPSFKQVLLSIAKNRLFDIPDSLAPFVVDTPTAGPEVAESGAGAEQENSRQDELRRAWSEFLETPFEQIVGYRSYVTGSAEFDTHQGVKGLEFPRVMVIASDADAGGFLFSYEKLFGAKEKTDQDFKNEAEGKETGIDRTRRLFYVTCSRAEEGLAIVAYSESPQLVRSRVIEEGWFEEDEIELISD